MEEKLRQLLAATKRYRRTLYACALALFVGGVGLSVATIEFSLSDIHFWSALLLFVVMTPVSLAYGSFNLMIIANGLGARLGFRRGFDASCVAQLVEILPMPGGAMVRTAALIEAGARAVGSTSLVLLGAGLMMSVALSLASFMLWWSFAQPALLIAVAATLGTAILCAAIARIASVQTALLMLLHRVVGCFLIGLRLSLAFAAIGVDADIGEGLIFGLANIAGSAAFIAPSGLGVGELLGAALASLTTIAPAAAFLALAFNRLVGLLGNGAVFFLFVRGGTTQVPAVILPENREAQLPTLPEELKR